MESGDSKQLFFHSGHYGGARDLAWVAFYDFLARMGMISDPDFLAYRDLLKGAPVYDMIQDRHYCILTDQPVALHFDSHYRLHGEKRPAIAWGDGFGSYYWHGLHTREAYIMRPEKLSIADFMAEHNIEQRRVIQEYWATTAFFICLTWWR
jgi:hypothetical protein